MVILLRICCAHHLVLKKRIDSMCVNLLRLKELETFGAVAQLDRASDCRSEG